MEDTNLKNYKIFTDSSSVKQSLIGLGLGSYWLWAALRIILTLLPQTGYIHPDEYFQTVEVFAGDVFKTEVSLPWEFNSTFPIRSIPVIYSTIFIPFTFLHILSQFIEVYTGFNVLSPYMLLVFPRLTMCLLSFLSDYCLFRICYLFRQNYKERLIIFSSSYISLIFMTRTFTNTMEVIFFNLLLYLVAASKANSEMILYVEDDLKSKYNESDNIVNKVRVKRLLKKLPRNILQHCIPIAIITTAGVFNRPTFVFYAVGPLFCWFERGLSASPFLIDFHKRIFVFFFLCCPVICFFILIDSMYYGYLTWGEILNCEITMDNFVVTPLNFARYNFDSSNLSKHGLHPKFLHALINIPLLYNVLGISGMMVVLKLFIRSSLSYWTLLPKSQSITGMMTVAFLAPLMLLSIFPHQEPRFLIPLLMPLVFLYSHLISDFEEECKSLMPYRKRFRKDRKTEGIFKYPLKCINYMEKITENVDNRYNTNCRYLTSNQLQEIIKRDNLKEMNIRKSENNGSNAPPSMQRKSKYLMKIWHVANILCILFFGFMHQGGIYGLTKYMHSELSAKPRYMTYHLVTSHIYSLPLHLLMLRTSVRSRNTNFQLLELGTENFENIHCKLITVLNASENKKKQRRRNYKIFYALPTSLFNEFRFSYHYYYSRNYTYDIINVYFPHFSSEALPNFKLNITDGDDFQFFNKCEIIKIIDCLPIRYLVEFLHQFGLILLQIRMHD